MLKSLRLSILVILLLPCLAYAQWPEVKVDTVWTEEGIFWEADFSEWVEVVFGKVNPENFQEEDEQIWAEMLSQPHPSVSTLRQYFLEASDEFDVPSGLLMSIGYVENNWTQLGPSIDRGWGIMHLVENPYCNTLEEASQLLGLDNEILKWNARQNIRAAAALISAYNQEYQKNNHKLDQTWVQALMRFSGLINEELQKKQALEYLKIWNEGIESRTLWGETYSIMKGNKKSVTSLKSTKTYSAEYPPAISSMISCNYTSGRSHSVDTWVNHWIGVGTYAGAVSWFHNCSAQASAHFCVKNSNGEITQCVSVYDCAWHCGASGYPYNNHRSIGVEHEATASNPGLWNSQPMLQAAGEMCCYFCNLYGIPIVHSSGPVGISGHNEMPGTSTACPGPLPWNDFLTYASSCNQSYDNVPPSTVIFTSNAWKTASFTATFTDSDNAGGSGLAKRFFQVLDYDGMSWKANRDNGFLCDNFDVLHPEWNSVRGQWSVVNGVLAQTDQNNSNTSFSVGLNQSNHCAYLYRWYGKISGSGPNRRAGIHFCSDNDSLPNRGNSYFVYFRADGNLVQIYKVVNDAYSLESNVPWTINENQMYDYRVIFDRVSGEIMVYIDNVLAAQWVDQSPHQSGSFFSFRSGDCQYEIDQIKVYHCRGSSEVITMGSAADMIRFQNPSPQIYGAKIKSIVTDSAGNLSAVDYHNLDIDWSPPAGPSSVSDVQTVDKDTAWSPVSINFFWDAAIDLQSGVQYFWISAGTQPGLDDVMSWQQSSGLVHSISVDSSMNGMQIFFNVKAENSAGLLGQTQSSDGVLILYPPQISNITASSLIVCSGDSLQFNYAAVNTDSVVWHFQGGWPLFSFQQNPWVDYYLPGQYDVEIIAYGPGGTDSLMYSSYIDVKMKPIAAFTCPDTHLYLPNAYAVFINTSLAASHYLWDFGDGSSSSVANPWHQYTSQGLYTVQLIAYSDYCANDTLIKTEHIHIDLLSYVDEFESVLNIFPNPATEHIFWEIEDNKEAVVLCVYDIDGRLVFRQYLKGIKSGKISLQAIQSGKYFIQIEAENKHLMRQFIKIDRD